MFHGEHLLPDRCPWNKFLSGLRDFCTVFLCCPESLSNFDHELHPVPVLASWWLQRVKVQFPQTDDWIRWWQTQGVFIELENPLLHKTMFQPLSIISLWLIISCNNKNSIPPNVYTMTTCAVPAQALLAHLHTSCPVITEPPLSLTFLLWKHQGSHVPSN